MEPEDRCVIHSHFFAGDSLYDSNVAPLDVYIEIEVAQMLLDGKLVAWMALIEYIHHSMRRASSAD